MVLTRLIGQVQVARNVWWHRGTCWQLWQEKLGHGHCSRRRTHSGTVRSPHAATKPACFGILPLKCMVPVGLSDGQEEADDDYYLPRNHQPRGYIDTHRCEIASMDTPIPESNPGRRLLLKLGCNPESQSNHLLIIGGCIACTTSLVMR